MLSIETRVRLQFAKTKCDFSIRDRLDWLLKMDDVCLLDQRVSYLAFYEQGPVKCFSSYARLLEFAWSDEFIRFSYHSRSLRHNDLV